MSEQRTKPRAERAGSSKLAALRSLVSQQVQPEAEQTASPGAHASPIAENVAARARDYKNLDPRTIRVEGFRYRVGVAEDPDMAAFVEAVAADGKIQQALSVRTRGGPLTPEYLLVDGERRLAAALANGFPLVPVRVLGEISDEEAFRLQVALNANRKEDTPTDLACAYAHLHYALGVEQQEIKTRFARHDHSTGMISTLCNAGKVILQLEPAVRHRLRTRGTSSTEYARVLSQQKTEEGRRRGILDLLEKPKQKRGRSTFETRPYRHGNGCTFRVSWNDDDLTDEGFVAEMLENVLGELARVVRRCEDRGLPQALGRYERVLELIEERAE